MDDYHQNNPGGARRRDAHQGNRRAPPAAVPGGIGVNQGQVLPARDLHLPANNRQQQNNQARNYDQDWRRNVRQNDGPNNQQLNRPGSGLNNQRQNRPGGGLNFQRQNRPDGGPNNQRQNRPGGGPNNQQQNRPGGGPDNQRQNNRQQNRNERDPNDRQQKPKNYSMGFRTLEEIANSDADEIIIKVNDKKKSFINLLESGSITGDMFVLIMEIISKVCSSTFDEIKSQLLIELCNSGFVTALRNYLIDLPYADDKNRNKMYWNDQIKFYGYFMAFYECIVNMSPSTALKCRPLFEGALKCCLDGLRDRHGFYLPDEFNVKLNLLRERLTICEKEEKEKVIQRKTVNTNDGMEPPDDFRALSVLPTHADLLESQPFLRANIVTGGYRDTEHYLDVQFRLLREDCFGPLRDGIKQYIENHNRKKYDNIRVYQNVKFVETYLSANKMGEIIKLDEKTMKRMSRINWSYSKRFIHGSLLLFTKDNCGSFITATILDRDLKLLKQGKIPVSIVDKVAADDIYKEDSSYTMIESEVYFEPYFHVLKALQDPSFPKNLAMSKYIVNVDPTPNSPKYLIPGTEFKVQTVHSELWGKIEVPKSTKFQVHNPDTWPRKEALGFNESQYEAYKLALTHEFAVIQGPPGTGKTFLGVKVAKTLIENLAEEKRMLVICYTNHALDQFLEAILSITDSIVRIGGQSRNEAMEKLNLTSLRKNTHAFDAKRLFFEHKNNLKLAVSAIQHAQKEFDSICNGIISYRSLKDHVAEVEFLGRFYAKVRDPLIHWLFEGMYYVDFDHAEVNLEENNDAAVNIIDEEDAERHEFILDDFDGDQDGFQFNEEAAPIFTAFSASEVEEKLKNLLLKYNKTTSVNKRRALEEEIVHLKSRLNYFNEMSANRAEECQLRLHNRTNFSAMSMAERWSLYFKWANVVLNRIKREMKPLQQALEVANTAYEEARMMVDLRIVKEYRVVGMTTSGAARLRKLLQALRPSIVIVEEAAEVLEQHIVTSLTRSCEHLVLIGDHQQLRPSAAYMRLARHFNIEVSLFERMISNGMHSRRLSVQHRMRPEFAALIAPHIYSDLTNHPSVEQFPNVRGMTDNLFFFTHNYKEEEVEDSASRTNQLEADMAMKLANYLMQQEYGRTDVTILAAYSGQMFYMRKQREKYSHLAKVKITVVDNYQGEESKIIILSLVRNNDQKKIGFLGTENRVCVALSRAKEGFYILGNIDILKNNSELWRKIATTLENNKSLGSAMMVKCERHAEVTMISSAKDFEKVPEGGCMQKCSFNLPCGHRCPLVCHGYDRGHVSIKCYQKCERILDEELCSMNHVCPLTCYVKCEPCIRIVEKTLPCGHKMLISCYKNPADPSVKCLTTVTVTLPKCGHEVKKSCYLETAAVKCPVPCKFRVQKCGHECLLKCHVNDDPDHEKYLCEKACAKSKKGCTADLIGDRGDHQCQKRCHEACDDCTIEVTKKRTSCKHSEKVACNQDVDRSPCRKNCARMMDCGHFCKKKCFEKCGDCTQKVTKTIPGCGHQVEVMCKQEASREFCRQPCERNLTCGHHCKQRCAEPCDVTQCIQLIDHEISAPCSHRVKLPCNVYRAGVGNWSDEVLLQYCTAPCGQFLACDHPCLGTCSDCRQGRLHQPCQGICGRTNICGHTCNVPCNQVCPPCNKPCKIKCPHSQCNQLCGVPCTPCQEPCTRECPHGACENRCGEPCSRAPCDEPCPLALPCGHRCRGLCGEPCPDICKICRPEQFPTNFIQLDDEFSDDDKIIRLQDCTHYLEVEDMDNLMKTDTESIQIRPCPICKTPIINTYRYKDLVNHMFKVGINPVKERVYGHEKDIKKRKEELIDSVKRFTAIAVKLCIQLQSDIFKWSPTYRMALVKLQKTVAAHKKTSLVKLDMQVQYLEILKLIAECYQKFKELTLRSISANISAMEEELLKRVDLLCSVLSTNIERISQQLQQDVGNEINRLNAIVQLSKILVHPVYVSSKSLTAVNEATVAAKQAVLSWKIYDQDKAMAALKKLEQAVKVSGVVTQEERALIVKALGAKSGSWYTCPNGHIYGIDQCGGAMEVGTCPECKEKIGGTSHRLLSTNRHANEMDGSRFAAWSNEYNNMANFQF